MSAGRQGDDDPDAHRGSPVHQSGPYPAVSLPCGVITSHPLASNYG